MMDPNSANPFQNIQVSPVPTEAMQGLLKALSQISGGPKMTCDHEEEAREMREAADEAMELVADLKARLDRWRCVRLGGVERARMNHELLNDPWYLPIGYGLIAVGLVMAAIGWVNHTRGWMRRRNRRQ
jgi:hypothetical protein